ncbi:carboxypeptidase s [Rhizoctonia solani]|uniref:Carboxypeptidase s n=1 Tax=Rhizoctonia solani TaxID=456999 RepID=A0A8H7M854_9AGAM|nr:carboxypeptidase s [Rhizoctonia solani]
MPANEKHGLDIAPARRPGCKSHLNRLLAAGLIASAALYCCRDRILYDARGLFVGNPEPKDYCKQVKPFDASNWTAVYDADGFEAKAAELLGGAVRIPTESFDNMGNVGTMTTGLHKALKVEKVNTYGLLFTWKGSDSSLKPLLLMGHQDVDQWKQPPFSGYYDGTYVWGRGSGDDKSGLIGILATVESLLDRDFKPTRTLVLSFGYDEEVGGPRGAKPLAERILEIYGQDGIAMIVDEGGSVVTDKGVAIARPAVGRRGTWMSRSRSARLEATRSIGILSKIIVDFEDNPYSVKLHRSNPMYTLLQCEAAYAAPDAFVPRFRKAIERSLVSDKALEFVTEVMSMDRVWRAFVGTTQAVDIVNGGVKANALPEQAKALINHRIAIESSIADVQKHIEIKLAHWVTASTTDTTAIDVAPVSPTDSEAKPWNVLSSSIRGAYRDSKNPKVAEGDIIVSPALMREHRSVESYFYWKLTKHIFRYNHHFASDLYNGAHTANEAYKASGFVDMIKFFTTLIINADQPDAL